MTFRHRQLSRGHRAPLRHRLRRAEGRRSRVALLWRQPAPLSLRRLCLQWYSAGARAAAAAARVPPIAAAPLASVGGAAARHQRQTHHSASPPSPSGAAEGASCSRSPLWAPGAGAAPSCCGRQNLYRHSSVTVQLCRQGCSPCCSRLYQQGALALIGPSKGRAGRPFVISTRSTRRHPECAARTQSDQFVSVLNRTRTVSEILYIHMHAAIRVTSQLANPPVSKSSHSLFPIHESAGREIRHRTIDNSLPCDLV
jgi:hypothetical protein